VFEFAVGIWLAKLTVRRSFRTVHECLAIGLAIASIVAMPLLPASFQSALFFIPASAALVLVFSRSTGMISRLLERRELVLLGDASFMLYMIHWPIALYLGHSMTTAALAIILSVVLHLVFERPVNRWLLRRWKEWQSRRHEMVGAVDQPALSSSPSNAR
jgi:peptidoglycan/LPS O-acetylase OafA/YrhL